MISGRTAVVAAALALAANPAQVHAQADSVLAVSNLGTSLMRLNTDASLVVRGTAAVGSLPASGAGVRMMWFPSKYAFRQGGLVRRSVLGSGKHR